MSGETRHRILVVEDDIGLRELLAEELRDRGHAVEAVGDGEAAIEALSLESADLVLCDLRLPGLSGQEILDRVRRMNPAPGFILITAFGTVPQAVEALKAGADDFLTKPLDLEHLAISVERVLQTRRLRAEVDRLRAADGAEDDAVFHGMYGRSPVMRALFSQIPAVARSDGAVLITGESGTGKELIARAVHAESEREDRPFVAVNCAGVPEQLLESEFFGHTAGAFTGASRARGGLFAAASGGTLFLDEIAEMPTALQAKLLRVLQEGSARAVGSDTESEFDARIIAATNRDPVEATRDGSLREDLFYRLETFTLHAPPLRERGDDLALLAARMVARSAARAGRPAPVLSESGLAALQAYSFPGNVRELENLIERALAFAGDGPIGLEHLPEKVTGGPFPPESRSVSGEGDATADGGTTTPTLAEMEHRYIRQVLERVDGNKARAAKLLGIGRRTLYRKLGEG